MRAGETPIKLNPWVIFGIAVLALVMWLDCTVTTKVEAEDPPPVRPEQPREDTFMSGSVSMQNYSLIDDKARNGQMIFYSYNVVPGCVDGNMKETLQEAMGNLAQFQVVLVEVPYGSSQADIPVHASCGVSFSSVCGSATACLGRGFPTRNDIDARTTMAGFTRIGAIAVWLHELLHALSVWNEQYATCGSSCGFAASPGWYDVMNTGPDSRHYLDYIEWERWQRTMWPPAFERCIYNASVPCVGLDVAGGGVYWCGRSAKTTIVSVSYDDGPQGDGYYASHKEGAQLRGVNECDGMAVEIAPGRCYYVLQNNRLSWPLRPWFQLAGCT